MHTLPTTEVGALRGTVGLASPTRPADHTARRNAGYANPPGTVRMQCQNPACRAYGLIVPVEREALTFAAAAGVHVQCRDCRHALFLVERPVGGAR